MTTSTDPFWALAHLADARPDLAMWCLKRFARHALESQTAFDGDWQNEICHLGIFIPEHADQEHTPVWPGTQLVERNGEEGPFLFVIRNKDDDPTSPIVHCVDEEYREVTVNLAETDWEMAGQ